MSERDRLASWILDASRVLEPRTGVLSVLADARPGARALALAQGGRATWTALLAQAAARATQLPVGVTLAGATPLQPVLILDGAATRALPELTQELAQRAKAAREDEARRLAGVR